jgi:hypothetical protein
MTIDLWHFEFKLRHNNIDSQHKKDFNPAEIDSILNDAIQIWKEQHYSGSNHKQTAFEVTQQRIDDLSSLVIKYPDQPVLIPEKLNNEVFEVKLSNLKYDYDHLVRVSGIIDGCTNKVNVKLVQHDDLNQYLEDPFKRPSIWPFPRLIGNFGKTKTDSATSVKDRSFYIYSNGTFDVKEIYFEYLKTPKQICLGGYKDQLGVDKTRVESDIPDKYHSQIIDIAVDEVRRILADVNRFQLSNQKQSINE